MTSLSLNADNPAFQAPHSNWVVQKFGGTSVGKFALNIIEQVVQYDSPVSMSCNVVTISLTSILQAQSCRKSSRRCLLGQK